MQQAACPDRLCLDLLALPEDGFRPAEVDACGGEAAEALLVAPMVVVTDESGARFLERPGQGVVLEHDPVLRRQAPALDLALALRMLGAPRTWSMPSVSSQTARSPGI